MIIILMKKNGKVLDFNINKTKKERPIKKIKRNNNKISNNFENSNDIKFSRNDENLESTDDFIKTNY